MNASSSLLLFSRNSAILREITVWICWLYCQNYKNLKSNEARVHRSPRGYSCIRSAIPLLAKDFRVLCDGHHMPLVSLIYKFVRLILSQNEKNPCIVLFFS